GNRIWEGLLLRITKAFGVGLLTLLAFAMAACGGDDDNGGSGGSGGSDGAWKGKTEIGTELALELWIPATDEGVAKFEALRVAAGAPAVQYAKVTATNKTSHPDT